MKQMRLSDYFYSVKSTPNSDIKKKNTVKKELNESTKKIRSQTKSLLTPLKKSGNKASKLRKRATKKMASSQQSSSSDDIVIISDDENDFELVQPESTQSQGWTQDSDENSRIRFGKNWSHTQQTSTGRIPMSPAMSQISDKSSLTNTSSKRQGDDFSWKFDKKRRVINDNISAQSQEKYSWERKYPSNFFQNDSGRSRNPNDTIFELMEREKSFAEKGPDFVPIFSQPQESTESVDEKKENTTNDASTSQLTPTLRVKTVSSINNTLALSQSLSQQSPSHLPFTKQKRDDAKNETPNSTMIHESPSSNCRDFETPKKLGKSMNFMSKTLPSQRTRNPSLSPIRSKISASASKISPQKSSQTTPNKLSPKSPKSPRKSPSSKRRNKKFSPRKIFPDSQDQPSVADTVENLNLFKQHVITLNDFNLNEIYSEERFEMTYGNLDTGASTMYDLRDVNVPVPKTHYEKDADRLFMAIVDVFANPINCGYFNEDELDKIFSILTLTVDAQILLAKMVKRKIRWTRKKDLVTEEIRGSLEAHLKHLVDRELLDGNYKSAEIDVVLELLSREEVSRVCKAMKVPHNVAKKAMIEKLLVLASKKPLFRGMKTPSQALQEAIDSINGECVKVSDETMNIISRILVLLYPTQDPEKNIADAFFLLHEVHYAETRIFPKTPKTRFPIFKNRQHLIDYVEAKNCWTEFLKITQQKNKDDETWEQARHIGNFAREKLILILSSKSEEFQTESGLPSHVRRFMPAYIWGKILSSSIESFKKLKNEDINEVVEVLEFLIKNRSKIQGKFIKWYSELASVEMNRRKNLERSAELVMEALEIPNLSDVDKTELTERARMLSSRAKNISLETKNIMKEQVELHANNFDFRPKEVVITAVMMQGQTGNKSIWQLDMQGPDKGYTSVERVAIQHYMIHENFPKGIHREGSLPMTLFTCFFWEELYNIFVPGAFVCPYQSAPLDLYGSKFTKNRQKYMEKKMEEFEKLSEEEFSEKMMDHYSTYGGYDCLILDIVEDPEDFKSIVLCLGKKAVTKICWKLANNLSIWKAGFPDLFLWNPFNKKCKVVEVKGPGDTLSVKQKLWIDFLEKNKIAVEVCHVRAGNKF